MGFVKAVLKILVLVALVAAVAGVAMLLKRSKNDDPVSFDEWPDVAPNPEAK
ncbi:MAG TPA: hypothetical protein PLG60_06180 [Acidimicrobiales bacterium]|nr:hypothetical protein [Acidimicrobiales bacterium]